MIVFSCSQSNKRKHQNGTPKLTELISNQIKFLDNEHKILFFHTENEVYNLKKLKTDLRQLINFDIDSTDLNQFRQTIQDCDGVKQKIWKNENFTLTISDFQTTEQKNQIELTKINIDSEIDHFELLTVSNGPLEYLKINGKMLNLTYESRTVGLDKAITKFKQKNCR